MGFSGDVCGALSGGACLLGLYAGRGKPEEEEDEKLKLMVAELVDWFSGIWNDPYGGISCEVILGDDPRNRTARCPTLVLESYGKVKALLANTALTFPEENPVR